jgi:hypothetical protein
MDRSMLGMEDGNTDSVGLPDETFDGSILGWKDGGYLDDLPDDTFDAPISGMEDDEAALDGFSDKTFFGMISGVEDVETGLDGFPERTFDETWGESDPDSPETTPLGKLVGSVIENTSPEGSSERRFDAK